MKKLFSLLLCLTLFLSVMMVAEAEELTTIDLGDFTLGLYEGDYYEVAPTKNSNEVYAIIYPAYDESATFHDNFNIVWSEEDASTTLNSSNIETFANQMLEAAESQFEGVGIKMTNPKVLSASYEDGVGAFVTSFDLDYTAAGVDLIVTMYQLQAYIATGEDGTYIFTFSASTLDDLQAMTSYLDNIEDK